MPGGPDGSPSGDPGGPDRHGHGLDRGRTERVDHPNGVTQRGVVAERHRQDLRVDGRGIDLALGHQTDGLLVEPRLDHPRKNPPVSPIETRWNRVIP
jgi:hypothetical protein